MINSNEKIWFDQLSQGQLKSVFVFLMKFNLMDGTIEGEAREVKDGMTNFGSCTYSMDVLST